MRSWKYVVKHFTSDKLEHPGQCFTHLQVTEQTFAIMNERASYSLSE